MFEEWTDENDKFRVPMTPEGDPKDFKKTFKDEKEFWDWCKRSGS